MKRFVDFTIFCILWYQLSPEPVYADNTTDITTIQPTELTTVEDRDGAYGLKVGLILFMVILVAAVVLALTIGLYKRHQYRKSHGYYKKRGRVYLQKEDTANTHNMNMFTVEQGISNNQLSSSPPSSSSLTPPPSPPPETRELPTTVYVGSS